MFYNIKTREFASGTSKQKQRPQSDRRKKEGLYLQTNTVLNYVIKSPKPLAHRLSPIRLQ